MAPPTHSAYFEALRAGDEDRAIGCLKDDPSIIDAKGLVLLGGQCGFEPRTPHTAINGAAHARMKHLVRALIEAGADLAGRGMFGETAMHDAAWYGDRDIVQTLLRAGSPLEMRCTSFDCTAIQYAVHGTTPEAWCEPADQVGCAQALLSAGAQLEPERTRGLCEACGGVTPAMAEFLARHGLTFRVRA